MSNHRLTSVRRVAILLGIIAAWVTLSLVVYFGKSETAGTGLHAITLSFAICIYWFFGGWLVWRGRADTTKRSKINLYVMIGILVMAAFFVSRNAMLQHSVFQALSELGFHLMLGGMLFFAPALFFITRERQ
jgi:cation transport ATPase